MSDYDFSSSLSSYGSGSPSLGASGSSAQKKQVMDQVRNQVAVAQAQELLQKMSDKCFKKCIYRPGTSLDSSEQKCIAMCMDRYMDSWNIVSRTYNARLQKEHSGGFS
ncbi:mitochondrial import inner membrane translocase subunit Tim13-B-like [Rhopilema esculentum]|uniref:mitochondrial import inner membrane translocase subunit Tim13-B-like n=1 Tax=Rhopilema esculentum TaxID=499914 RepID=UPI0031DC1C35